MALGLVQTVVVYYGAFPAEIDERIERNERVTAEAHTAWLAGQARCGVLLDEMLSPVIAEQLRAHGQDVEAIRGARGSRP